MVRRDDLVDWGCLYQVATLEEHFYLFPGEMEHLPALTAMLLLP